MNAALPPLTEFVLPGGTRAAAAAHVCRTVCRRAERVLWSVTDADDCARYLNRLSDWFFVAARVASIMCKVSFPRNQFVLTIAIQIG